MLWKFCGFSNDAQGHALLSIPHSSRWDSAAFWCRHVDLKCLSQAFSPTQSSRSSSQEDSLWRVSIKMIKSSLKQPKIVDVNTIAISMNYGNISTTCGISNLVCPVATATVSMLAPSPLAIVLGLICLRWKLNKWVSEECDQNLMLIVNPSDRNVCKEHYNFARKLFQLNSN